MPKPSTRRSILTGAAAAAAVSLAPAERPRAGAGARATSRPGTRRTNGSTACPATHRTIIDCASTASAGAGILYANNLYVANARGYSLKEADVAVVVCLRHLATVFAFNDVVWAKYGKALSDAVMFTDPKTGQAPSTNLLDATGYGMALPNGGITIASVAKRGTQFAVCDMATNRLAGLVATSTKGVQEAVYTEFVRNLIPNSHLMSAGVVAVNRAQEYGYTLLTAV